MPAKIIKRKIGGKVYYFYRRKGGAWEKTKSGHFKKVGTGKGSYSRRMIITDLHKKPHKRKYIDPVLAEKYPQAYDHPAELTEYYRWKREQKKKKKSKKSKAKTKSRKSKKKSRKKRKKKKSRK